MTLFRRIPVGPLWGPRPRTKNLESRAPHCHSLWDLSYLLTNSSSSHHFRRFAMSALRSSPKQLIGWAFCMVIFPVIPFSTVVITQPTFVHMLVLLAIIGVIAAFIGRQFAD